MSEVVKLQLIGLSVVGFGTIILLFIQVPVCAGDRLCRRSCWGCLPWSRWRCRRWPPCRQQRKNSTSPISKPPTDMAAIGQKIFFSKGQCALCHSIGPSESARCPDLKGIGAKLTREFMYESLTQPQAYVYLDFRHEGMPKEYPARMPYINKNPIGLSKNEILSVIAFLQQMSGEPISVNPSELDLPRATPAPVKAADAGSVAVAQVR